MTFIQEKYIQEIDAEIQEHKNEIEFLNSDRPELLNRDITNEIVWAKDAIRQLNAIKESIKNAKI